MTSHSLAFQPRWACPTGQTILDILHRRGIATSDFPRLVNLGDGEAAALLEGRGSLTIATAHRLSEELGGSVDFWMARDSQYQDDMARLENASWVESLPTRFMVEAGWMRPYSDWVDGIHAALTFFDVSSADNWQARYSNVLEQASFRRSTAFDVDPPAVAAWLRQGERLGASSTLAAWDPETLQGALGELKGLTRLKDPVRFLPRLQEICGGAGLFVLVLRAPPGCPVSGASAVLPDDRRVLLLTARYLADDHLWFTLFHEIGHLLLHSRVELCTPPGERDGASEDKLKREQEADDFAGGLLVPPAVVNDLRGNPLSVRQIVAAAQKVGVSPGIVVGQLQYHGVIPFDRFNQLKRRYRWAGSRLAARS